MPHPGGRVDGATGRLSFRPHRFNEHDGHWRCVAVLPDAARGEGRYRLTAETRSRHIVDLRLFRAGHELPGDAPLPYALMIRTVFCSGCVYKQER